MRAARVGLVMVAVAVAVATPARAEDPAAAEALFREGRALFAEGKLEAACAKFKASQSAEPSPGTLLNLAACHRAQGKSATAWAEFVAAARLARAQRKDKQEAEATRRVAELEPTLSYLTLRVDEPVPGLEVRRGGTLLESSVLGARVPVDPGSYIVEARAPGYEPLRLEIEVAAARDEKILTIPQLVRQAAPIGADANVRAPDASSNPAGQVPPSQSSPASQTITLKGEQAKPPARVLPWIVGGVGVAALTAGGVAGFLALGSNRAAKERCPEPSRCNDEEARSLADRRDTEALVANIGVGAGLVGLGVAAVLFLSSGSKNEKAARALVPVIAPHQAGLAWTEQF